MFEKSDFYRVLLDSLQVAVYFLDTDRRIRFWSRGAECLTGYPAGEILGELCSNNILNHTSDEGVALCSCATCPAAQVMASGEPVEQRIYFKHRQGHRVPIRARVAPVRDASGQIVGAIEVFYDDSSAVALEEQLQWLRQVALLDPLTEIGNRRHGELELRKKLDEMTRYGWTFAVFFVDIDDFKVFNDRYGHALGDQVLHVVAQTLSRAVRSFDVVCRWGGEEFLIILSNIQEERLRHHADRLRRMVEHSIVEGPAGPVGVTVSIGVTLATAGDTVESVVARGDQMMYASKRAGRNRVTAGHHVVPR